MQNKKIRVGILGATGMVGQRLITLLVDHPWFEIVALAASPRSAGKKYAEAVEGRWNMEVSLPEQVAAMQLSDVVEDIVTISESVDLVFSAISLEKERIRDIENSYAAAGVAVVSNNSAHRWSEDVPMIVPEVNAAHLALIHEQRKLRGWSSGCIVVKPNCSIQSYVMVLSALRTFVPMNAQVTSMQAVSGAGRTLLTWPEMQGNIIPFIDGEEEKSEREPVRIWGNVHGASIELASVPTISATCVRVPVLDGHMASVGVSFRTVPTRSQIMQAITDFNQNNALTGLDLPSAPSQPLQYFEEPDRPQSRVDSGYENGMGVTMGRLREGKLFDWDFISLAHNTLRGAAGGSVLTAELLVKKGFVGSADPSTE